MISQGAGLGTFYIYQAVVRGEGRGYRFYNDVPGEWVLVYFSSLQRQRQACLLSKRLLPPGGGEVETCV